MEYRIVKGAHRVLVVDDEKAIRDILAEFLTIEGFSVIALGSVEEAVDRLRAEEVDIIVTDLEMPGMKGTDLLKFIVDSHKRISTIIMTGYGTVETAIEAMKLGACDYILKPFKIDHVVLSVKRALEKQYLEAENIQLKETLYLYNLSEIMGTSLDLSYLLDIILATLMDEVGADAAQLYLRNGNDKTFALHTQKVKEEYHFSANMPSLDFQKVLDAFEKEEMVLLRDSQLRKFFRAGPGKDKVFSFIAVPLKSTGRIAGMISAYSLVRGKNFTEGQRKALAIVAGRVAAHIENARLYTNLQSVFKETIHSLTRALEAKDGYTQGHSERVTQYAGRIARCMKLSPQTVEDVVQAARLHDIGKIGMRLELINKPGKLTVEEISMFREHPVWSKKILEPISFFESIIPMVFHHHERWDGFGYPNKLREKDIPLGARILAVADSYAVMTEDRPYRKALSHMEAVKELRRCAGTQFDPEVVKVFAESFDIPEG